MADERDLELLDDYLTNRMGEQDRSAFEQKLQADPDLQHEYALQQRLIKGIKHARVAQLKSMLNQVPVPATNTGSALASKIVFGTVITLMVVATAWYFTSDDAQQAQQEVSSEQKIATPEEPVSVPEEPVVQPGETAAQQESVNDRTSSPDKQSVESDKNQTSAGTEHSKPSLAKKPDPLQAPAARPGESAPGKEPNDGLTPTEEGSVDAGDPLLTKPRASTLLVETDRENKSYSFHYQFKDGKLVLYGPFEKSQYETMEFFTDEKRTVFLVYREQFYRLNEADTNIRPLQPVTDAALLKKLKAYRSK